MKKFLTLAVSLCLAMCAAFALTACGSDDVNPAGKTYGFDHVEILTTGLTAEQKEYIEDFAQQEMGSVQITFKSDKTYEVNLTASGAEAYNPVQTGKWKADGNKVVLTPDDDDTDQTYIYSGGKFYGNVPVPYGEEEDEVAACRLWFTEVKE